MIYLAIKKQRRARKDGREYAQAMLIRKGRKFGPEIERRHIGTRHPVLITGAHHSGKSRWLNRLHADAALVWPSRAGAVPLLLVASDSMAQWTTARHLESWWAGRDHGDEEYRPWSKLRPWERTAALPLYLRETGAVLFVDDAHAVSTETKKAKVLQSCIRAAGVWVMATQDEGRLFPSLRTEVKNIDPQRFHLSTETSYDGTAVFMYFLMALCLLSGAYEAAIAIGGLKFLASGRRATKGN